VTHGKEIHGMGMRGVSRNPILARVQRKSHGDAEITTGLHEALLGACRSARRRLP
jgi:hypothetical protein